MRLTIGTEGGDWMLSRKYYEMIAEVLALAGNGGLDEPTRLEIAVQLCNVFASDNPAFDSEKFFNKANVQLEVR